MDKSKFQCPVDFENYVGYDCTGCYKYRFHNYLLKRYGKRATCRVAVSLRLESKDVV